MTGKVFVYGTLKRGFANHLRALKGATLLGEYRTVQRWPLVITGERFTPAVLPEKGRGLRVIGEVYLADARLLSILDRFESVRLPDGYCRELIEVESLATGEVDSAFIYTKARRLVSTIHTPYLESYQDRRYRPRN